MKYNRFPNSSPFQTRFGLLYHYRRPLAYTAAGISAFYLANMDRAPVTNRLRFMIIPNWLENVIGNYSYRSVLSQFQHQILPPNAAPVRQVESVLDRIIKVSGLPPDLDWKVHVIGGLQNPPNAFVLPGGKVFVFESILPICRDIDGLATVLSHEVAHQVCKHSMEQLSRAPLQMMFTLALFSITGYNRLGDILIDTCVNLPFSRANETEADIVGLMMMSKACFDPNRAIFLWQRMASLESRQGHVPEILSTHPPSQQRIQDIRKHLPEAEHLRSEFCGLADNFWSLNR